MIIQLKVMLTMLMGILGLIMGSFLNCIAYRFVGKGATGAKRSHCPCCGHVLKAPDLIPVVSYIQLKGHCRYCGAKIDLQYLLAEVLGAALYISLFRVYGLTIEGLQWMVLGSIALCIACCDGAASLIPNRLILAGILWRFLFLLISGTLGEQWLVSLCSGFIVTGPVLLISILLSRIRHQTVMGGGDIKLIFMLGLYFPWGINLIALMISCGAALIQVMVRRIGPGMRFPFGPALCVGWWAAALWGQRILQWYLEQIGL